MAAAAAAMAAGSAAVANNSSNSNNNSSNNSITISSHTPCRSVKFGPSSAMEFDVNCPARNLTPLPPEQAARAYPCTEREATDQERELDRITKENTATLLQWADASWNDDEDEDDHDDDDDDTADHASDHPADREDRNGNARTINGHCTRLKRRHSSSSGRRRRSSSSSRDRRNSILFLPTCGTTALLDDDSDQNAEARDRKNKTSSRRRHHGNDPVEKSNIYPDGLPAENNDENQDIRNWINKDSMVDENSCCQSSTCHSNKNDPGDNLIEAPGDNGLPTEHYDEKPDPRDFTSNDTMVNDDDSSLLSPSGIDLADLSVHSPVSGQAENDPARPAKEKRKPATETNPPTQPMPTGMPSTETASSSDPTTTTKTTTVPSLAAARQDVNTTDQMTYSDRGFVLPQEVCRLSRLRNRRRVRFR